jgi:hypothetical protein
VQKASQWDLEERETAAMTKRWTVREHIVKVGSRAQIWSM